LIPFGNRVLIKRFEPAVKVRAHFHILLIMRGSVNGRAYMYVVAFAVCVYM
jgi:hypothetical protein